MKDLLSGNEIRQQFVDFFVGKGHTAVRSASLVPVGDQTLLFTNAGMVQFKDVFLGTDLRPYTRAVDSQKCMRVAGKHNDLDDVGRDDSHHTFFEMLGNWSFGDYYKKEAISWAWELLTEVWGLDKSKLWTTCFKDEKGEVAADEEAFSIWQAQPGIDPSHVLYFGRKENFWEMADTGPCGPCSEIHMDMGPDHCNMKHVPGHVCRVNGDCSRYMELWNLVFIQYNRLNADTLVPLAQKFVDTGMGFERIVSVLQRVNSNYRSDLFRPMIQKIQALTGASDEAVAADFTPYRVIADHVRASSFLIADGVVPGNIGRNYVCRMIIRRAVRFGQQLGLKEPFMAKVAEMVITTYQEAYPELVRMKNSILNSLQAEEERFNKTLENGIAELNEIVAEMRRNGERVVSGATCFNLYSTHGLPLEITFDVVREFGFDVDREAFKRANESHRIASGGGKAMGKMGGDEVAVYNALLAQLKENGSLGEIGVVCDPYDEKPVLSQLTLLLSHGNAVTEVSEGEHAEMVVGVTNFYLEMGGQVGDTGTICGANGEFIFDVQEICKPVNGLYVHRGVMKSGAAHVGENVVVQVDAARRHDIKRNHTATHLLHAALHQVVGEESRQAGSLVAPDRLRFDFHSNRALTADELQKIEELVNAKILETLPVTTKIENLDDAMKEGVTAIFNEKYGDVVRVIRIADEDDLFSAELCGGTHVCNTSEIGLFFIISEGSVATGIRRIEAVSGTVANCLARKNNTHLRNIANHLNVSDDEVFAKVVGFQDALSKSQKEFSDLKNHIALKDFDQLANQVHRIHDVNVLAVMIPDAEVDAMRVMADQFKSKYENGVVILGTKSGDQALFIASVSDSLLSRGIHAGALIKTLSEHTGGRGGGRPGMAQGGGKAFDKIESGFQFLLKQIEEKVK